MCFDRFINGNKDVIFLIGIIGHCTNERNLLYRTLINRSHVSYIILKDYLSSREYRNGFCWFISVHLQNYFIRRKLIVILWDTLYYGFIFFPGYGDIVPVTTEGKVFTLAYAILGIPVFMWYIVKLGGLFRLLTMYIFSNMTSCFW